ncbi:MAG: response regulator transcription factor [Acidobacteriota bacterium]|jgi:two-component system phosphate regulon response regulator PhoB
MAKILVVDDDQDILDLLSFNLNKSGFQCVTAPEGRRGMELALSDDPDLIVLDVMMPGESGVEVLKRLKYEPRTRDLPVIMLTAKSEEVDRILGLELGADDYVIKPFSVRELMLRVQRILERVDQTAVSDSAVLRCHGISLNSDRYEVRVQGTPVRLTTTEFNLLAYLLKNKGRVLSRDRLLEQVWGYRYGGTTRTVDTHIQRLRDKLGPESDCIETVRGVGYKVEVARN